MDEKAMIEAALDRLMGDMDDHEASGMFPEDEKGDHSLEECPEPELHDQHSMPEGEGKHIEITMEKPMANGGLVDSKDDEETEDVTPGAPTEHPEAPVHDKEIENGMHTEGVDGLTDEERSQLMKRFGFKK
jgi:hypothetical protein